MAAELIRTTLRQQFDAIVARIEEELLEATRTLGFKTESKPRLFAEIERELALWYREAHHDPGQ
jgi:hypothetical protein